MYTPRCFRLHNGYMEYSDRVRVLPKRCHGAAMNGQIAFMIGRDLSNKKSQTAVILLPSSSTAQAGK